MDANSLSKMSAGNVTVLLQRCQSPDPKARKLAENELFGLVFPELRIMARHKMFKERPDHTLQATALVNQAYLKLVPTLIPYEDRRHFFGAACHAMWEVLVNHARERGAQKRHPPGVRVDFSEAEQVAKQIVVDVLELDDVLEQLARDMRGQQLVDVLRFRVLGFSYKEIAQMLGIGETKASRIYDKACARLRKLLVEKP